MQTTTEHAAVKGPGTDANIANNRLAELSVELLGDGTALRFRARGSSMRPFIRDGDILTVAPVRPEDLRPVDIVFFKDTGGRILVHRVTGRRIAAGDTIFTTRGDAALVYEEAVPAGSILGRVTVIERRTKRLAADRPWRRAAGWVWMRSRFARYVLAGLRNKVRALSRLPQGP